MTNTSASVERRPADRRLLAAARLAENLAYLVPEALATLNAREFSDGWPASTESAGVHGGSDTTRPEAAALLVSQARAEIAQIYDDSDAISIMVRDAITMVQRIIGSARIVDDPSRRCTGGMTGRWARMGGDEWGDPSCADDVHARGLCPKHYVAARRWCMQHGVEFTDRTPTEV